MTPPDDLWNHWLVRAVAYSLLATLGGVMGYLMRSIDQRRKICFLHMAIEGSAAGFVGFLVLLVCESLQLDVRWIGVIVGVAGWLGANATIRLVESAVYSKLGIQPPNREQRKDRKEDHAPDSDTH